MNMLSEEQIVENLSPWYRSIFKEVKNQKVYSGEQICYAADFTGNGSSMLMDWGFMIFTDRRYLKVFKLTDNAYGISYHKSEANSIWDKILGQQKEEYDRRWMIPNRVHNEKHLANLRLPKLWDSEYSKIKGIIRNDYSVQYKSEQIPLVELRLEFINRSGNIFKTFKGKDGVFIHDLLNLAMQNDGKLPSQLFEKESSNDPDVIRLTNAIADLRKAGLLTEEEFEQKRQEILKRL